MRHPGLIDLKSVCANCTHSSIRKTKVDLPKFEFTTLQIGLNFDFKREGFSSGWSVTLLLLVQVRPASWCTENSQEREGKPECRRTVFPDWIWRVLKLGTPGKCMMTRQKWQLPEGTCQVLSIQESPLICDFTFHDFSHPWSTRVQKY